jgi:hypothetical protein
MQHQGVINTIFQLKSNVTPCRLKRPFRPVFELGPSRADEWRRPTAAAVSTSNLDENALKSGKNGEFFREVLMELIGENFFRGKF